MELIPVWTGDIHGPSRGYLNTIAHPVKPAPQLPISRDLRTKALKYRVGASGVRIRERLLEGHATKLELAIAGGCGVWTVGQVLRGLRAAGVTVERVYTPKHLNTPAVYWIQSEAA